MNIEETQFPKQTYVGNTTTIKMAEMKDNPFFQETYSAVGKYAGVTNQEIGTAVAIYKSWSIEKGEAETFVGFSVAEDFDTGEFERFDVEASNALSLMHLGSYDGLGESHQLLMRARREAGHTVKLAIEEYLNSPDETKDVTALRTRIHYLY